jgi:hypothetical protein
MTGLEPATFRSTGDRSKPSELHSHDISAMRLVANRPVLYDA